VVEYVVQRLLRLEGVFDGFDALPLVALLRKQLDEFVVVKAGEQPDEDVVTQANRCVRSAC
jgi:hypothetical protein